MEVFPSPTPQPPTPQASAFSQCYKAEMGGEYSFWESTTGHQMHSSLTVHFLPVFTGWIPCGLLSLPDCALQDAPEQRGVLHLEGCYFTT